MKTLLATAVVAFGIACVVAPPALFAQQKTAKECRDEWRANKDANKAAGITEKDYVAKCRDAGTTTPGAAPTAAPAPAPASQAKTAKECRDEWRANKDVNKAAGITQKDYVAKCRGETAQPAATPTVPAPAAAAPAPSGEPKTAKACRDEWRANRDANKAAGITEKDYVAKCRGGGTSAQPINPPPSAAPAPSAAAPAAPAAAPAPTPSAAAPAAPAQPPVTRPKQAPTAAATPTGANQYSTEAQAKARCPSDTVVWVNLDSKIYHFSGYRNYGTTKEGAYMCEKDAVAHEFNAAKNETHP